MDDTTAGTAPTATDRTEVQRATARLASASASDRTVEAVDDVLDDVRATLAAYRRGEPTDVATLVSHLTFVEQRLSGTSAMARRLRLAVTSFLRADHRQSQG